MSPILVIPSTTHTLLHPATSRSVPPFRGVSRRLSAAVVVRVLFRARVCVCVFFFPFFLSFRKRDTWSEQETPWESEQSVFRSCVAHRRAAMPPQNTRALITRRTAVAAARPLCRGTFNHGNARFKFARLFSPVSMSSCKSTVHVRAQIVIRLSFAARKNVPQMRHSRTDFRAYILDPIVRLAARCWLFFFSPLLFIICREHCKTRLGFSAD